MYQNLRADVETIVRAAIAAVLPDEAVRRALEGKRFPGRVLLVAAGKAAWPMARTAVETLGRVDAGVVVTKYGHVQGEIPGVACYEAGHPVPDENSFRATQAALDLAESAREGDTVLFLLSGGGSALLEKPLLPGAELQDITGQLLACGAGIVEMNTIRKRLSAVKGGRFALACAPASVYSIVLSDVLGDPLDMIASGPAAPDRSTCAQALAIAQKYRLRLSPAARALLARETPKALSNVETQITGSVRQLCAAAADACRALGYQPLLLTDHLDCEAREAGRFLAMDSPAAATLMYLSMSVIVEYISAGDIAFRNTYARLTNEMSEATSDSLLCLESSSSTSAASTHGLRLRTMSISIFVSRKTLTARTSQKNTRLFPLRDPGCV